MGLREIHFDRETAPIERLRRIGARAAAIALAIAVFAPAGAALAAVTFQAAGTAVGAKAPVSPAWPAHQANDIALLFVESSGGEPATLSTSAGFVQVTGSPQATGTTTNGTRITVFWARATSAAMATPTVADPGSHVYAQILTYRGAVASGNPWDVTGGGFKAAATTSVTLTGVTTTVANTLVVQAVARDNNSAAAAFSAQTNAALTGIIERSDAGTSTGTSKGGGFGVWDGTKATAGTTGSTTATVTSSINAFLTIALAPAPPPQVTSINRADPDPSSASTVSWTVTFSSSVTGVSATAFTLAASGLSGAFISSVSGSGTAWTVVANTGIGAGSLGLNQTGAGAISPTPTGTFSGQVYTISSTPALAEYRMDQISWNGTAGEVVDSAGAFPGTAVNGANTLSGSPAIAGNPGTCGYGVFDNGTTITQGYVQLPGFPNLTTDFTITAWIRTTDNTVSAQRILIDDETGTGGYGLSLGDGGAGVLRFYSRGTSAIILDTGNVIANNTWYFVAGVADITNGIRLIYVYNSSGTLVAGLPVSVASTGWGTDAGMASIGAETNLSSKPPATNHFKGNIDELRVYPKVLSQAALTAIAAQTHTCAVVVPTPGGFNAFETSTAAAAIAGVITTKVAGSTASLDVVALNPTRTAVLTGFTGTVRVEVLDSSNNSGPLDATTGCRSSWTNAQTLSPDTTLVAGDNGRKTISFTQANSYSDARIRITYPAGAPTVTGCSGDNFALRPNGLSGLAVSDTDWLTAGTTRVLNDTTFGTTTHKAGRPFSVRATALNAAATPAVTTNYAGAPTATLSACVGAACTATFGSLTLNTAFSAGLLVSDVATYDNVGAFQLQLVDSSFASVDTSDTVGNCTSTGRYVCSTTTVVGRSVPDHLAVSYNTPAFGTACTPGGFTYVGQTFNYTVAPVITVRAENAANGATTLYAGTWWRITPASLTGKAYAAASGTLVTTGLPATDPVISDSGGGSGTLTFGSGTGMSFSRASPQAPFNAEIGLAISVIDADNVAHASNPARFGAATAGNGIAFSSGKPMRFGRLRLQNAFGPLINDLPVTLQAEYWNGTAFATNTLDSCLTLAADNFALSGHTSGITAANMKPGAPAAGNISIGGAFSNGVGTFRLTKPSPAASTPGGVVICADLDGATPTDTSCAATTPANIPWLKGNWGTAATYIDDPKARATFGLFGAQPKQFIFQREYY